MPLELTSTSPSVAQPASHAEAGFHSLPPEMMQEILAHLGPSDLLTFELARLSPGELTPDVFNLLAHDFIVGCEQTWPSRPWPSRAIACCYAWVREQFEGTDEQFAQSYPDTARLVQILRACATLDQPSPVELQNRFSRHHIAIDDPRIHAPIAISSADDPAFVMVDRMRTLSLVSPDGTISHRPELRRAQVDKGTAHHFPIVNSMYSRNDRGLLVSRQGPVDSFPWAFHRPLWEFYRPSTQEFHRLHAAQGLSTLCAVSENGKFMACTVLKWSPESREILQIHALEGDGLVREWELPGSAYTLSVDSRGVAVVCLREIPAVPGEPHSIAAYEIPPVGPVGPPVRLPYDCELTPGYILAPGEGSVIQNGLDGSLIVRSREDGRALTLSPPDPSFTPRSLCVGPGQAQMVVTYLRGGRHRVAAEADHQRTQFVGVFDLTSVSSDHTEALLPTAWFELPDSATEVQPGTSSSSGFSSACLTQDASRLIIAYKSRVEGREEAKLLTVDLSPEGRAA